MGAKWSHFMIGAMGCAFAANGAACGPTTIDQGGAGGGSSSSTASSAGSAGGMLAICDPMNLPVEGSACMTEGEVCSPGCEDPCAFCNLVQCMNGAWTNVEAFPAPCLSCEDVCVPVVAAQCSGGPPDQMTCVQGCTQNQMKCMVLFNQMLACIGPMPTFSCDAMNRPTVTGCETEFDKLYGCIMP
jgi:hypothetical protein